MTVADRQGLGNGRATAVLLAASTGCAMTVLDTNIVAVVLPGVARDLGASFAQVEWLISAYVLCFASLLLPAGAIADRFGRRRIFLVGILAFALSSLLCGAAPTALTLTLARAAQGVGAAFLLAPALAIIGHAFHAETQRAKAWATWGAIMGLTMVLAPLLGGLIAYVLGWRWAFYVNLPICAALAVSVLWLIPESRDAEARRLDPLGIIFFAMMMLGLTWGLIQGQAHGWNSAQSLVGFGVGVSSLVIFLIVETCQARPMLDLSLFRLPRFVGAVLAMFAYAATAQVMASLLPLYLQNGLGRSPLAAGLGMLPFALAMLTFPQVGRRLDQRLQGYHILSLGLAVVCAGNVVIGWAAEAGAWFGVALGMAILGAGGGLLNGETQKAIMGAVPRHRSGMASGISTTARFSGILLGFAGLSAVLAIRARETLTVGFRATFQNHASRATEFVGHAIVGDASGATAVLGPDHAVAGLDLAHRGYAEGFSASLFVAAAIAAGASVLVVLLMRPSADPQAAPVSLFDGETPG